MQGAGTGYWSAALAPGIYDARPALGVLGSCECDLGGLWHMSDVRKGPGPIGLAQGLVETRNLCHEVHRPCLGNAMLANWSRRGPSGSLADAGDE